MRFTGDTLIKEDPLYMNLVLEETNGANFQPLHSSQKVWKSSSLISHLYS